MAEKIQLYVEGMSCGHCVKAVENSLGELKGIKSVAVTLAEGLVAVSYNPKAISIDTIKEVLNEEGYTVQ